MLIAQRAASKADVGPAVSHWLGHIHIGWLVSRIEPSVERISQIETRREAMHEPSGNVNVESSFAARLHVRQQLGPNPVIGPYLKLRRHAEQKRCT